MVIYGLLLKWGDEFMGVLVYQSLYFGPIPLNIFTIKDPGKFFVIFFFLRFTVVLKEVQGGVNG